MSAEGEPVEIDGLSTEPMIIEKGYGDVDAAFSDAHAIVEADVAIGRHSAVPMETRGAIARYDAARDLLELHGSGQSAAPQ
jgi:carbon-monoxide dehydrogenase large subunit/6-hydroxypseudooxynicotine dehydrogenase subunit gamma